MGIVVAAATERGTASALTQVSGTTVYIAFGGESGGALSCAKSGRLNVHKPTTDKKIDHAIYFLRTIRELVFLLALDRAIARRSCIKQFSSLRTHLVPPSSQSKRLRMRPEAYRKLNYQSSSRTSIGSTRLGADRQASQWWG